MTFCELRLPVEVQKIRSIAAAVMGEEAEASIACVSPLETAGDKLSAFTWRVVVRDRDAEKDDPTMIRHLHDLAALEATINREKAFFVATARNSLEQDQLRRGGDAIRKMSVQDRLDQSLAMLRKDGLYRNEYGQFVLAMSYAEEENRIDFDGACSALERIINIYGGS